MSLMATSVGIGMAVGAIGEFSFVLRALIAIFSIFLAVFGFYHGMRHRKTIHIDISGSGQFRLTEVTDYGPCRATNWPHVEKNGKPFRLMKNSTIWSCFLLLRLQSESGRITNVPVMLDCVSQDDFRALSVACRWVAEHGDPEAE